MASIEDILAEYEAQKSLSGGMSIADQYMALQGLSPEDRKKKEEGLDLLQPVRTAFSAFAAPGGMLAGIVAPGSYETAREEQRQALGVTEESPWYEKLEALPGAGGVVTGAMSPEFKASGLGRVAAPITQIVGDLALDPTTYIGVGAAKGAGLAARAAGASNLIDAAALASKVRKADIAAAAAQGVAPDALKLLREGDAIARAADQARIATEVLTKGTGLQKAAYRAGGFLQQAEPVAFAAPAALAYGPQTIAAAYEQAKGIPESETPIADAASVALLSGMTLLMGKGLMSAGDALKTWQRHAQEKGFAAEVITSGEEKIIASANEQAPPPPAPTSVVREETGFELGPVVERQGPPAPPAGFELAPEAAPVVARPPRGAREIKQVPLKEAVLPEVPPEAVSIEAEPLAAPTPKPAEPLILDQKAVKALEPLDNQVAAFIEKNGGAAVKGMPSMLQRRYRVGRSQAMAWLADYEQRPEVEATLAPEPVKPVKAPKPEPPPASSSVAPPPRPAPPVPEKPPVPPTAERPVEVERPIEPTLPQEEAAPTPRVTVDAKEIADAKLTNEEVAFVKNRVQETGNERVALDEVLAQRAARKATMPAEAAIAPETAPKMLSQEDLANPLKEAPPIKPQEAPVAQPKGEAPPAPAEAPTGIPRPSPEAPDESPLLTTAKKGKSEQEHWDNYIRTLRDMHAASEEGSPRKEKLKIWLDDALAETSNAKKREIIRARKNYGGLFSNMIEGKQGLRGAHEQAAVERATASVELGVTKNKPLAPSEKVTAAIDKLKAKHGSLRAWMNSADSGEVVYKKSDRPQPYNLKDVEGNTPAKIWKLYVDRIDSGMSDVEARKWVVDNLSTVYPNVSTTKAVTANVVSQGRARILASGSETLAAEVGRELPTKITANEFERLKIPLDAQLAKLTDETPQDLVGVDITAPEFKGKILPVLSNFSMLMELGKDLGGGNLKIKNLTELRALAKKVGVRESDIARKGTIEIIDAITGRLGLAQDYAQRLAADKRAIEKPISKEFVTTVLHPKLLPQSGGRNGVFLRLDGPMVDATVLANDIIKNAEVTRLTVGEDFKVPQEKALAAELDKAKIKLRAQEMEGEGSTQIYHIERGRVETMEARPPQRLVSVSDGKGGHIQIDPESWGRALFIDEPGPDRVYTKWLHEEMPRFADELAAELKKKGIGGFDADALKAQLKPNGRGSFHATYFLKGATGPNGENYLLRVGRNPYIPLPTTGMRALVQPVLGHGTFGVMDEVAKGVGGRTDQKFFYTLHQTGYAGAFLNDVSRIDDGFLRDAVPGTSSGRFDAAYHLEQQIGMEVAKQLPPGMDLHTHNIAVSEFIEKARLEGLDLTDLFGRNEFKGNNTVWLEIPQKHKIPDGSVWRKVTDENGHDRTYRLVVSDFGAVAPKELSKYPVWKDLNFWERISLMEARHAANRPTDSMPWRDGADRLRQYAEDLNNATRVGDTDLKIVNHDRIMSGDFLEKYQVLGERPAIALQQFHDKLAKAIGKSKLGSFDTRFEGLTASPHLAGLYHELAGERTGRIFVNLAEAVNHAESHEQAIDDLLYTMIHEVTHARYAGHGTPFRDLEGYIRALAKAEGVFDEGRGLLRESLSKTDYERVKKDLVPEFNESRSKYGTFEAGRNAEDLAGVSTRRAEGSTEAVPYRYQRDQADLSGNRNTGVRAGADVQGGGQGAPGQLRTGATAGRVAAAPPAEGRPVGSATGEGGRATEGGVRDQAEGRIEEQRRITGGKAHIQALMDELLEQGKSGLRPVRDVFRRGYEYASQYVDHMSHDEMLEAANSLPSPRHPDQNLGVLNLLHYPDMDLKMKARIAKWYEFTKGAWPRDKVEHWEDVAEDVKDLLGVHTPEEWTRIYSSKGGGLTSRDVELLRQVHNELTGRVLEAEDRLYDGLANNVGGEELTKLRKQLSYQERAFYHSMLNVTRGLTGVARALAIARHKIRELDPILRMEEDLKAGLRERLSYKFKDKGEVEQKVRELMDKFHEIREAKNGDWEEFYKAYNAMLGSRLWPDKILEFYKAGLLGWPSRVANISSNTLFRAVRYVEDAMAGAVDKAYSSVTGAERSRYIGEASVSALALRRSLSEGFHPWLKAQGDAFALRPEDVSHALQKGSLMEDLMQHPGAIEGKLGEFLRFPFKGLSSDDALAKHMSRVDNMYRQIYRKVRSGEYKLNPGETHTAATERIYTTLNDNFQSALNGKSFEFDQLRHWQEMAKTAEDAAKSDTFQADLGNFGRGANWLLRNVPALQIVFPFVRTPTNIAKETLKRTPLGFIELARKWKGLSEGERITELSKPAVGTLIGAGLLMKALDGSITGGGPLDPDELETLKATGWQPYSVKLGDQWISYQRFEPIAAIMGIAADSAEGIRNGDFQKWQTGAMRVFQTTAENVTNKTFLSGLDGMFSAVSHPKQYLNRFVKQMQGSIIPNSLGFVPVSGITRALDPVYRQTDPLSMNVFYAKLPYLSSTLDPQYGPTGELRVRSGSALERVFSPFSRTEVKVGPAADGAEEVVRLSAAPKAPGRYWIGRGGVRVDFTGEEKAALAKAYREATFTIGQRLVKDPNYKKVPDDEYDPNYRYGMKTKKDIIRKLYNGYRDSVMDRIKPSLEARAARQVAAQRGS